MLNFMKDKQNCEICYRIICKQCGWVASDYDVSKIQKGELSACPTCGWKPGDTVSLSE